MGPLLIAVAVVGAAPLSPSVTDVIDARPIAPPARINTLSIAVAAVDAGFVVTWASESSTSPGDYTLFVQVLDRDGRPAGPAQVASTLHDSDGSYASITRCGAQWVLRYRLTQRATLLDAHGAIVSTFPALTTFDCPGTANATPAAGPSPPSTFAVETAEERDDWKRYWSARLKEKQPRVANTGPRATWSLSVPWFDPPFMFARARSTYLLVWTTPQPRNWRDEKPPSPPPDRRQRTIAEMIRDEIEKKKRDDWRAAHPPDFRPTVYRRPIEARVDEAGDVLEGNNGVLEVGDSYADETRLAASDDAFLLVWRTQDHGVRAGRIDAATGAVTIVDGVGPDQPDVRPTAAVSDGKDFAVLMREPHRVTVRYPLDGPLRALHSDADAAGIYAAEALACADGRCVIAYAVTGGVDGRVMAAVVAARR